MPRWRERADMEMDASQSQSPQRQSSFTREGIAVREGDEREGLSGGEDEKKGRVTGEI